MIDLYMVGVFYLECMMVKRIKERDRSAGSLRGEFIQPWFIAAAPLCYLFNPAMWMPRNQLCGFKMKKMAVSYVIALYVVH